MTADETTAAVDASPGAWKRLSDLKNDGLVVDTGQRRAGRSGRQQIVWAAVEPLDW